MIGGVNSICVCSNVFASTTNGVTAGSKCHVGLKVSNPISASNIIYSANEAETLGVLTSTNLNRIIKLSPGFYSQKICVGATVSNATIRVRNSTTERLASFTTVYYLM
jgi:uncharacterized membrane protein YfhO